jgi:hypothetical protein
MKKLVLSLLVVLGATQLSCGSPNYCREGSFPTFLDEEWRTYCADYDDHMNNVGAYGLPELTSFLGKHPERVSALSETKSKYKDASACFVAERDKLEYRKLDSCLTNDDQQNQAIGNAWAARAEPWLEDHSLRLGEMIPKLGDQIREAARLDRKVSDAFEIKAEVETDAFQKFADENEALGAEIERTADIEDEWRSLKKRAKGNEALVGTMQKKFGGDVEGLLEKVSDMRGKYAELRESQRYLEMATFAAGKPCPSGLRSNKEIGIAKKSLAAKIKTIGGVTPRAMTSISKEMQDELETESFEGFTCAPRSTGNQFVDKTKLCAVYRYVLQRDRPANERSWGDWTITAFEEGGAQAGIDCGLLN